MPSATLRSAKPSATPPSVTSACLRLRVRSVEGSLVTLDLVATDHRIIIGQRYDYLIGNGVVHAFSAPYTRSGS